MVNEIYPLVLRPVFKDYIWGGTRLNLLGKNTDGQKLAESWEASCHSEGMSTIGNGPYKNKTLEEVIEKTGAELIGTKLVDKEFPILLKFLDTSEKLSIQVHPTDEKAKELENQEYGKTEMWYIISAEPEAYIYYGLKENVTQDMLRQAVENGAVEGLLNKVEVEAGDVINLLAGTVHALGSGITAVEVQQNSNLTYRLFDYNRHDASGRPRLLHIEKAIQAIDFSKTEQKKHQGINIKINDNVTRKILAANQYFAVELWDVKDSLIEESDEEGFFIYSIIKGNAKIDYAQGEINLNQGETVFIPAGLDNYIFKGQFQAIKAYVPDLEKDIYKPLERQGVSRESIREILV
jgi:mannose-6-phosphate isomerase